MIQPLIRRVDEEAKKNYSTIKTTPESIVRLYRLQSRRRDPVDMPYVFSPSRPRIPWNAKINWDVVIACAVWTLVMLVFISLCIFFFGPFLSQVSAKEIDVSVSVGAIYDQGKWTGGPDGTRRKADFAPAFEGQVKYTGGWKYQPTLAISYRQENFEFRSQGAPVQETSPRVYGIHIGATREFEHFSVYGLVGLTHFDYRVRLVETFTGKTVVHKGTPDDNLLSFRLGLYKLWDLGALKIGPEVSADIYPMRPGFDRCREFRMNIVVPHAGVRVQW